MAKRRKVIQIVVVPKTYDSSMKILALCDDGTIWSKNWFETRTEDWYQEEAPEED
jgi:hypothetical protein